MNLLLRFYDPQGGDITLDGNSIKSLNIRYLRSQLGYVGQEPVLFTGTVADNIAYGIPPSIAVNLSPAEIRAKVVEASKLANAHDFISSFPSGYDTDVGSAGVAMSGGQKQRIAIARALVKKPAVLLLDEATSALDATSERIVQESIDKLSRSKAQTTIVIAHRLSTIRNADKIAVVSEGVIAELGNHAALVEVGGIYRELVSLQMGDEEEDSEVDEVLVTEEVAVADELKLAATSATTINSGSKLKDDIAPSGVMKVQDSNIPVDVNRKRTSRRIWSLVMVQGHWLAMAILGGLVFGGSYPIWGLLLAKTQTLFYYTDAARIRHEASNVALYFFLLAIGCFISAIMQYYGIAQVGEKVSMKLRGNHTSSTTTPLLSVYLSGSFHMLRM
jgi:ATP-binding cassette subfamily B (MDR/TAP) protein 1